MSDENRIGKSLITVYEAFIWPNISALSELLYYWQIRRTLHTQNNESRNLNRSSSSVSTHWTAAVEIQGGNDRSHWSMGDFLVTGVQTWRFLSFPNGGDHGCRLHVTVLPEVESFGAIPLLYRPSPLALRPRFFYYILWSIMIWERSFLNNILVLLFAFARCHHEYAWLHRRPPGGRRPWCRWSNVGSAKNHCRFFHNLIHRVVHTRLSTLFAVIYNAIVRAWWLYDFFLQLCALRLEHGVI